MDYSKLSNDKVRSAIRALQSADPAWYSLFTETPNMTNDGARIDFRSFFEMALGKEMFITIDQVRNCGRYVCGSFKAGNLGTFKVFFRFRLGRDGKFNRLDIGELADEPTKL